MLNPLYTYIKYVISKDIFLVTFLNKHELFFITQLNGFTYFYLIRIILFIIDHLIVHS